MIYTKEDMKSFAAPFLKTAVISRFFLAQT